MVIISLMIQGSGDCIIKLITVIINSLTQKASVFVKANALGYCTTEFIKAVISFMIPRSML
jgi:hypothetical protein